MAFGGANGVHVHRFHAKYNRMISATSVYSIRFTGAYDYVYMPLDSQTLVNKGYAFINFTEPTVRRRRST